MLIARDAMDSNPLMMEIMQKELLQKSKALFVVTLV